nr:uncharacterized protein LOC111506921 [Leptinotarsa decemlineata]
MELRDIGLASILDGLFLPKIENIKMTMFHCNPIKDDIERLLTAYKEPNDEAKCLILFSTTDQRRTLYKLLKYIVPEDTAASVALGGGIIKSTKTFQRNSTTERIHSTNEIFCIAFLKDKNTTANFDAFSHVIHGDALSKDEFAEEVLKFKEQIKLRTYTAAIRICCSAKVDASDEPRIFNKIFPDVPLLGFHAEGEIGWNCIYSEDEKGGTFVNQDQTKTAFCLLGFPVGSLGVLKRYD